MSDSSQNCPWVAIWVFWLLVPKGSNEDGWGPLENSLSVAQCLRTFVWYCMWTSLSLYRFIVYLDIHVVHQIGKVFIFVSWNSIALFFSFPVFFVLFCSFFGLHTHQCVHLMVSCAPLGSVAFLQYFSLILPYPSNSIIFSVLFSGSLTLLLSDLICLWLFRINFPFQLYFFSYAIWFCFLFSLTHIINVLFHL